MEYIKNLMNLGVFLDPSAGERLATFDETKMKIIMEKAKEERPIVLTNEIIDSYLKSTNFKILRTLKKMKTYTMQDAVDALNKRYDFIQGLLMRKIELSNIVSINKCGSGKITVIGIVKNKEKSNGNIVLDLEDKTGTLRAVLSKDIGDKIDLDDIIAVSGNYNNNILFGEKAVYPDVPLRKVSYSDKDTKVLFAINHDFKNKIETGADYIFIAKCDNVKMAKDHYPRAKIFILSDEESYLTNPSLVEIDGIVILALLDFDPLSALKKRFLTSDGADFVIDSVPDIILTNRGANTNYKSISLIAKKAEINLKTRTIKEL